MGAVVDRILIKGLPSVKLVSEIEGFLRPGNINRPSNKNCDSEKVERKEEV